MNPNSNQWHPPSPSSAKSKTPFSEQQQQQQLTTPNEPLLLLLEPFSDDFTASLASNERRPFPSLNQGAYLRSARKQAVQWTLGACSRLGFGATTVLLAADHLDRCFLSPGGLSLRRDGGGRRWMTQLSAVACLSLAAKVEETCVPLLLDLQTTSSSSSSSSEYLFESKTVKRMELLVLSTLQWKMNPATALSFVQCVVSKTKKKKIGSARDDGGPLEVLKRCEAILLSSVADWRWVRFPPSVWASAALMHANVGVFDELQHFMDMLEISKERVEECHEVVVEIMGSLVVLTRGRVATVPASHRLVLME
ncbi:cyclin-D3-3-like [Iris pallida]|uniref:Cyclin-D3-3-like n=1 Tax=Iris pallida TaxID=29817 RepID=A0AAX6GMU5_IRIPA|nr:cyclin-D3-3-like [Iris pallida]